MTLFPGAVRNQSFPSAAALGQYLADRASRGVVDHPGQMHPADAFRGLPTDEAERVGAACAEHIAHATDPRVLLMCAILGPSNPPLWQPALLDRLEQGPPIPEHPGTQGMTLLEELTETFAGTMDASTRTRAHRVLADHCPPSSLAQFLSAHGTGAELAYAIDDMLATSQPSVARVRYLVGRVASTDPGQLMLLVPSLATLSEPHRQAVAERVARRAPGWAQLSAFQHGLGL